MHCHRHHSPERLPEPLLNLLLLPPPPLLLAAHKCGQQKLQPVRAPCQLAPCRSSAKQRGQQLPGPAPGPPYTRCRHRCHCPAHCPLLLLLLRLRCRAVPVPPTLPLLPPSPPRSGCCGCCCQRPKPPHLSPLWALPPSMLRLCAPPQRQPQRLRLGWAGCRGPAAAPVCFPSKK